ncbi:MAG TPA: ABC transporter ATP-binding protein [Candidatus Methylomirabilis sp.]|nr:ABC transporter ATP-binding protein [Candidatus Methylomirabilis sp.]
MSERRENPLLAVESVDAGYGGLQALRDVTLQVAPGEIVSLVGPNGAGKSTLIKVILGLVPVRRGSGVGEIRFKGERIDGLAPEKIVGRGIAVVPEGARVFPDMSVLDNLHMGAIAPRGRVREADSLAEVFTMFPRLRERRAQAARTLSGGERQMLAIGRALMARPELLLLDEPSLGLQPSLVRSIIEAVQRINERGLTVLLIEQNVHFSLPISDRGYVLEQGRVVLEDSGPALLQNPHVRLSYLGV